MKFDDLSSADAEAIRKGVKYFDPTDSGKIKTEKLGTLLRSLKLIPSNSEIAQMVEHLDPNQTGSISNSVVLHLIAEIWPADPSELERTIWGAFLTFDKLDIGVLTAEEIRLILTSVGKEPIPESEVKKVIREFADPKTGKIQYGELIRCWMK